MKILHAAVAGTLESSDVMVRIEPLEDTLEVSLQITSSVEKQFGDAINAIVLEMIEKYDIQGAEIVVDDKGALECVLRARLEALLARACDLDALPWEDK
ncbi:citrate lyase acyl carrier protein [Providencia sp. PROV188]|jgi:citrate lyase subunit gamma (acyl carrier protein)|uniref:Citrate lyase acyl carrier protein n=2 Tax=Providencia TaxID=586 RepID=A0A4V2V4B3_9GAMM|nr:MULTISPECIES: citrate lyase acyl carrier protein [Providencia]MBS0926022.1 citrate lyase acyl carrier protein [Providencia sp. JGM181]MBS0932231.1 citrate lyase acyl carrier protein [Providencia sp. JGM172]MBS0996424.1 citrate lyase acyl carrier protein [Providencia sp. JGM178]MTB47352.1 citrate lyase acyl carrier protein [Providencia sp. wls1950]MTB67895.1 citrate lyase acyl carrier protein [Providencia sp. wls1943]MTC24710.1 citrate lyase acyl carrier protein [Providencia sp. wls1938]MT